MPPCWRKTSEYARDVTPLLGQPSAVRATPSIVQWAQPATRPAQTGNTQTAWPSPSANQPATLAAAQLKQDDTVPRILPESADQISPNPHETAPVTASTDEYEQKLQNLVHDYPRDLGNQLDYQLLRLVRDEPTPDMANVSQLSGEDRDILLALMDGLSNFRDAARNDGNVMLNRKIQPLLELADRLRSQAQLSIPTVAFCSQVVSYGVYSPMPSSRLPAGRNNDLIVYCEVANFTSIQGNDAIWRTRLRQEMVLYTDTGLAVWPAKSQCRRLPRSIAQSAARFFHFPPDPGAPDGIVALDGSEIGHFAIDDEIVVPSRGETRMRASANKRRSSPPASKTRPSELKAAYLGAKPVGQFQQRLDFAVEPDVAVVAGGVRKLLNPSINASRMSRSSPESWLTSAISGVGFRPAAEIGGRLMPRSHR